MTTVAYKDGVMACDSCWAYGSLQTTSATKIDRLSSGALFGQSGDLDTRGLVALLSQVKTGKQLPFRSALDEITEACLGILVLPDKSVWMVSTKCNPSGDDDVGIWPCDLHMAAVGTGSEIAIGAMAAGKTAAEAVAIACQFDINSRPPVHELSLPEPERNVIRAFTHS